MGGISVNSGVLKANEELEDINSRDVLEFWYGSDFENHLEKIVYPTYNQIYYLMKLNTGLSDLLVECGVKFPHQNEFYKYSLLKPKKAFKTMKSYNGVSTLIDLHLELNSYLTLFLEMQSTIALYKKIERSFKKFNKYFSIPKKDIILNYLYGKIPLDQIQEEEMRQEKEKKRLIALEEEKSRRNWLDSQWGELVETIYQPHYFPKNQGAMKLYHANTVGLKYRSTKQVHYIQNLYLKTVVILHLLNRDYVFKARSLNLLCIDYMSFGEVGRFISFFEDVIEECCEGLVENDEGYELNPEVFLTENWINTVRSLGRIFPNLLAISEPLVARCNRVAKIKDKDVKSLNKSIDLMIEKSRSRLLESFSWHFEPYSTERAIVAGVHLFIAKKILSEMSPFSNRVLSEWDRYELADEFLEWVDSEYYLEVDLASIPVEELARYIDRVIPLMYALYLGISPKNEEMISADNWQITYQFEHEDIGIDS